MECAAQLLVSQGAVLLQLAQLWVLLAHLGPLVFLSRCRSHSYIRTIPYVCTYLQTSTMQVAVWGHSLGLTVAMHFPLALSMA